MMLRSPPPALSVCFRSAVWCDFGVVQFEAEIIIEPQTTLQALIFFFMYLSLFGMECKLIPHLISFC